MRRINIRRYCYEYETEPDDRESSSKWPTATPLERFDSKLPSALSSPLRAPAIEDRSKIRRRQRDSAHRPTYTARYPPPRIPRKSADPLGRRVRFPWVLTIRLPPINPLARVGCGCKIATSRIRSFWGAGAAESQQRIHPASASESQQEIASQSQPARASWSQPEPERARARARATSKAITCQSQANARARQSQTEPSQPERASQP
jgi:hypothetical protein